MCFTLVFFKAVVGVFTSFTLCQTLYIYHFPGTLEHLLTLSWLFVPYGLSIDVPFSADLYEMSLLVSSWKVLVKCRYGLKAQIFLTFSLEKKMLGSFSLFGKGKNFHRSLQTWKHARRPSGLWSLPIAFVALRDLELAWLVLVHPRKLFYFEYSEHICLRDQSYIERDKTWFIYKNHMEEMLYMLR